MTFYEWKNHAEWDGDQWRKNGLKYMSRDDALRAAWDASRREAFEQAAKRLVMRALSLLGQDGTYSDLAAGLEDGASVIRELAAKPKGTP